MGEAVRLTHFFGFQPVGKSISQWRHSDPSFIGSSGQAFGFKMREDFADGLVSGLEDLTQFDLGYWFLELIQDVKYFEF